MLQHQIDQQIGVEEEEEEEEENDKETKIEVKVEADETILEMMKINQISKIKVEADLISPRQNVLDVINLVTIVLSVITNYLTTKKMETNQILQKRIKWKPC